MNRTFDTIDATDATEAAEASDAVVTIDTIDADEAIDVTEAETIKGIGTKGDDAIVAAEAKGAIPTTEAIEATVSINATDATDAPDVIAATVGGLRSPRLRSQIAVDTLPLTRNRGRVLTNCFVSSRAKGRRC